MNIKKEFPLLPQGKIEKNYKTQINIFWGAPISKLEYWLDNFEYLQETRRKILKNTPKEHPIRKTRARELQAPYLTNTQLRQKKAIQDIIYIKSQGRYFRSLQKQDYFI